MEDDKKVILLEQWFGKHVRDIAERYGEYQAKDYARSVNSRLESIFRIVGISILSIAILLIGITKFSEETLSTFFIFEVIQVIYGLIHLVGIRRVHDESGFDNDLVQMWTRISLITSVCAIAIGGVGLYEMSATFNISIGPEKEKVVNIDKLGVEITIPKEWSSIEWECKSDESSSKPRYYFNTYDNGCKIWFDLYGFSTPLQFSIDDFIMDFTNKSKAKFSSVVLEGTSIIRIAGKKVLKSVGKDKSYPDLIYARYQLLHCGTMIYYTYRFTDQHDYQEEIKRAEEILSAVKFTQVQGYARKPVEDKRPDDCIVNDKSIDITSAKMRFNFPGDCLGVEWQKKDKKYIYIQSFMRTI